MSDTTYDRMNHGRKLFGAAPMVAIRVQEFHDWMVEAARLIRPQHLTPVIESARVVALDSALGRFDVAEELSRTGEELVARIVFFRAATALHKDSREVYCVRIDGEGGAHFGPGPEADPFEWDAYGGKWVPRNILRIAYEIAIASTAQL